jgi:hypothetical protein
MTLPQEAVPRHTARPETSTMTTARIAVEEQPATWSSLATEAAGIRDHARFLHEDARALHQETRRHDLDARTAAKARASAQELLDELAGRGYSWRMIARLTGVTVPALRKWRQGESPSGENRRRLAELAAFSDFLEEYAINDVAGWLEVPLNNKAAFTCADLCASGRIDLVLDYAANRIPDPNAVLDQFDPEWRSSMSDYEVFTAGDGSRSIRRRQAT